MLGNDLTGKVFGYWTVIRVTEERKYKDKVWICKCICGKEVKMITRHLISGDSKSCGCMTKKMQSIASKKNHTIHGKSNTRLHRIWTNMRTRCNNSKFDFYKYYGGKGVEMCEEWNDFENFYKWAIANGYDDKLTIDRIDVNKSYYPENCRWTTMKQQCRNRTNNIVVEHNGEKLSLVEWSEKLNISVWALYKRYSKGYTGEILLRPIIKKVRSAV